MLSLKFWLSSLSTHNNLLLLLTSSSSSRRTLALARNKNLFCCCVKPITQNGFFSEANNNTLQSSSSSSSFSPKDSPFSGLEDAFVSYLFGKKKATDLAHMVWKHVVRKGDTVVDATCGNGFDTLEMLNLVADDSHKGHVYAFDIQKDALDKASTLLEESLNSNEKQLVKLVNMCHSKMEEVVSRNDSVRLVAFNLGYLPGGDKEIITRSETTLLALEAAKRILVPGGLISIVVYVGHPGGREEMDAVETFAVGMPAEDWICCKLSTLNRPFAPVPIFLFRR